MFPEREENACEFSKSLLNPGDLKNAPPYEDAMLHTAPPYEDAMLHTCWSGYLEISTQTNSPKARSLVHTLPFSLDTHIFFPLQSKELKRRN